MNFCLLRDVKASGLYFLLYSYSLERMREGEARRENTGAEIFLAGGLAGRMMMMIQLPLTSSWQACCPGRPSSTWMWSSLVFSLTATWSLNMRGWWTVLWPPIGRMVSLCLPGVCSNSPSILTDMCFRLFHDVSQGILCQWSNISRIWILHEAYQDNQLVVINFNL